MAEHQPDVALPVAKRGIRPKPFRRNPAVELSSNFRRFDRVETDFFSIGHVTTFIFYESSSCFAVHSTDGDQ
jgi:hypothetical protein